MKSINFKKWQYFFTDNNKSNLADRLHTAINKQMHYSLWSQIYYQLEIPVSQSIGGDYWEIVDETH